MRHTSVCRAGVLLQLSRLTHCHFDFASCSRAELSRDICRYALHLPFCMFDDMIDIGTCICIVLCVAFRFTSKVPQHVRGGTC